MTLQEFINSTESKYAIIRTDSYLQDPVAQSISASPRHFDYGGIDMTLLSLDPSRVAELAAYAESAGNGVEYELTIGSGKVTLMLRTHVIRMLADIDAASS